MLINCLLALSALAALGVCALCGGFAGLSWLWMLPAVFCGTFLVCILVLFLMVVVAGEIYQGKPEPEKENPFIRWVVKWYAPPVMAFLGTKIRVTGMEKVPNHGRFMLVCNHIADLDTGVLLTVFNKKQLAFIAKKETREMFLIGKLMPQIHCQFLNRENDREGLKVILRCIDLLKKDENSVAGYPEGAIIEDGKALHHFRNGIFKVAQRTGVPIVVCTLRGTVDILPNFKRLKSTPVDLRILDVVPSEETRGVRTDIIGRRVYNIMAADLGVELMEEE